MSKVSFITGNFNLNIEGELSEEQRAKADEAAIRYIVQRDGATKTYLELCGVENEKGNKSLPKDFERDSLEYSADSAEAMRVAMEKALAPYGNFKVSASEHVKGESQSPMKRATEFVDALLDGSENEQKLRSLLSIFGAKADATRDDLIAIAHEQKLGKSKA
jgi:hypothetical protein